MPSSWYYWIHFLLIYFSKNDGSSLIMHETEGWQSSFNLPDHDCLYYLAPEESPRILVASYITPIPVVRSIQIIDYCRRVWHTNESYQSHIHNQYTFEQLKQMQVASEHLYQWSAPIELIEDYQSYIYTNSNISADHIFYNCSQRWFGAACQYTFNTSLPFDEIVAAIFSDKLEVYVDEEIRDNPCYIHLPCDHGGVNICLDWREICDGFWHCSDGIDERDCYLLEQTQCQNDEYRCRNGYQCIPRQYVNDDGFDADCLDRSDEKYQVDPFVSIECTITTALHCEDTTCPSQSHPFGWPCGDGQCASSFLGCRNRRHKLWRVAMLESTELNSSRPDLCRQALSCIPEILPPVSNIEQCSSLCWNKSCSVAMEKYCPDLFDVKIGFTEQGSIRLMYRQPPASISYALINLTPEYVCIETNQSCPILEGIVNINGLSCWHRSYLNLSTQYGNWSFLLRKIQVSISDICSTVNQSLCPVSLYQCQNSNKCISKNRILDGIQDCRYGDDEECFRHNPLLFPCPNQTVLLQNEEDARFENRLSFGAICDGYQHFRHLNSTDETNCDFWECNNTYTHCNGFWSCKNGLDEVNCPSSPCPMLEHRCISPLTNKFTCLPIDRVNNNIDDCVGATDEPLLCKSHNPSINQYQFRCLHTNICIELHDVCNNRIDCPLADDQLFCSDPPSNQSYRCYTADPRDPPEKSFLCNLVSQRPPKNDPTLRLTDVSFFPIPSSIHQGQTILNQSKAPIRQSSGYLHPSATMVLYCHRGMYVIMELFNQTKYECLCPPAYYGDRCQYQNERVSLTLSFRAPSNWRTIFTLVITLKTYDQERRVHSKKQIDYIAARDCDTKFDLNLLYDSRPKNLSDLYAIVIDAYIQEHSNVHYYASWFYEIPYVFLPVNRMVTLLFMPVIQMMPIEQCPWTCKHGRCYLYVNTNHPFCQCERGWSGLRCDISYECHCAKDSHCAGHVRNRSICVCPLNRFGPRCLLTRSICHFNPCLNDGTCVATDDYLVASNYTCICQNGFYGLRCENRASHLEITFHQRVSIPSYVLIHLVSVIPHSHPTQASLISNIPVYAKKAEIFISIPFNIIVGQMNDQFYLLAVQNNSNSAISLSIKIQPSYRCFAMWTIVPETIIRLPLLDRIKFYHLPCKQDRTLNCFYDVSFMCICDLYRRSNCFRFNYTMSHDCQGNNYCEHNGACLQDHSKCPTSSVCACQRCYYGSRCQFSSNSTGLSLDIIFGSHIQPKVSFLQQSSTVQIASIVNLLMVISGTISAVLSIVTFRRETIQQIGCGLYLYVSSFFSLFTMIGFGMKFWLIVLTQMMMIRHELFMIWQCRLVDYSLRTTLTISNWLNACVAMERIVAVASVDFEKKKSRSIARYMIIIVILAFSIIEIYDPLHRRLIDDRNDRRLWCVVSYSSSVEIFHSIISLVLFLIPYGANLLSSIIIVTLLARRRSSLRQQTFMQNFRQQIREHKTLIISPLISVILSLPQLITSILPSCISSMREPWLFIISYYVAFIPPLMIFPVYVLTSKIYRKEFLSAIRR